MRDLPVSLIRTVVPTVVGLLVAWAARAGIGLDPEQLQGVIETVAIGLYYAAVRWAEGRWPVVGWLLGVPSVPSYPPRPVPPPSPAADGVADGHDPEDDAYGDLDGWAG